MLPHDIAMNCYLAKYGGKPGFQLVEGHTYSLCKKGLPGLMTLAACCRRPVRLCRFSLDMHLLDCAVANAALRHMSLSLGNMS